MHIILVPGLWLNVSSWDADAGPAVLQHRMTENAAHLLDAVQRLTDERRYDVLSSGRWTQLERPDDPADTILAAVRRRLPVEEGEREIAGDRSVATRL